jgi:hypothetical protein
MKELGIFITQCGPFNHPTLSLVNSLLLQQPIQVILYQLPQISLF